MSLLDLFDQPKEEKTEKDDTTPLTVSELTEHVKTLLEKGNAKKFIDFFYLNAVSNSYLKKMWKRKLKIFPKIFIQPFENLNCKIGLFLEHDHLCHMFLIQNIFD